MANLSATDNVDETVLYYLMVDVADLIKAIRNMRNNLETEILRIRLQQSRSYLIADLFSRAVNDIHSYCFENIPCYKENTAFRSEITSWKVLNALIFVYQENCKLKENPTYKCERPANLNNVAYEWNMAEIEAYDNLQKLFEVYKLAGENSNIRDVSRFIGYLQEKKQRNRLVHFSQALGKFSVKTERYTRPHSFGDFLRDDYDRRQLIGIFSEDESLQTLNIIFYRCCKAQNVPEYKK